MRFCLQILWHMKPCYIYWLSFMNRKERIILKNRGYLGEENIQKEDFSRAQQITKWKNIQANDDALYTLTKQ